MGTRTARGEGFDEALLSTLIPADPERGMPAADLPGLAEALRERIEASPEQAALLDAGLDLLEETARGRHPGGLADLSPAERAEVLEAVEAQQPLLLRGLLFHLCSLYYQRPEVLAGLGLAPRAPFPEGYTLDGDDEPWFERARARALSS